MKRAGRRHAAADSLTRDRQGRSVVVGITVVPRPSRTAIGRAIRRFPLFTQICNPAPFFRVQSLDQTGNDTRSRRTKGGTILNLRRTKPKVAELPITARQKSRILTGAGRLSTDGDGMQLEYLEWEDRIREGYRQVSSRYRRFSVRSRPCCSPLWTERHLECYAAKGADLRS